MHLPVYIKIFYDELHNKGILSLDVNDMLTWPAMAYRIVMIQGKQQHSAIPITKAKATQKIAKNTSNARKITVNLFINKPKYYVHIK